MRFNILLIIVLILESFSALADHITVQGDVSGEWTADTVLVAGDITVRDGESLMIAPGTRVEFQGSFAMFVEGSVSAIGTQTDSICFRIADTTGFGVDSIPDGGWRGIRFAHTRNSNDSSLFVHCRFSYGKNADPDPAMGDGGIFNILAFNKLRIDRCRFTDNYALFNGGAVALDSADVIIKNSVFTRNRSGKTVAPWGYGGAVSSDNSNPLIRWNTFTGNSSTGVGGAISVRYEDCDIYNNVFTGNYSALGGALSIGHMTEANHRINNNLIAGNASTFFGGGVANLSASPIYINNTIVYNTSAYGGGFYCKDSVSPDFYNTVFWGNSAGVGPTGYLFEVFSQADFFNCNVEGGPDLFGGSGGGEAFFGVYEQCLDTLPGFAGSAPYPYSLAADSPCIDAGSSDTTAFYLPETDLAGAPRLFGPRIDMGAYEWFWVGVEEEPVEEHVRIWPNPCMDHIYLEVQPEEQGPVTIEVFDITGRKVFEMYSNLISSGNNRFLVDVDEIAPGYFIVVIQSGKDLTCKRILKGFSQGQ